MKEFILGLNPGSHGLNYHDPSVCLLDENGIVFAIEEERLNRIRHSCGMFPEKAVEMCRKYADQMGGVIKFIAIGHQPQLWGKRSLPEKSISSIDMRMILSAKVKSLCSLSNAKVSFFEHHKAHAASAFYCSNFSEALCIVMDGAGETASASAWIANSRGIQKIDEIAMPNSLGYFYAQATSFLGFVPWSEEGKLMALAPYGEIDTDLEEIFRTFFYDGRYDLSSVVQPCLSEGYLLDAEISNSLFQDKFKFEYRKTTSEIIDIHRNFAFLVQSYTEKVVESYIRHLLQMTNQTCLCAAGGLFMNCKMNGYLRDNLPIKKLFVQPVSGDAGTALGAAFLQYMSDHNFKSFDLNGLSLGSSYSNEKVLYAIKQYGCHYSYSKNVAQDTAEMLASGKIIAWFQGGSELGCRALCHRSILAPPHPLEISNLINKRIKHRETWRPFACSMLVEFADEILLNYEKSQQPDYMIEAFSVKKEWQHKMDAVIHRRDCSTRPQIIRNQGSTKIMYNMLSHYYKLTGYPMVLNTSLNDKGQPIIQTPEQAVRFFVEHDIDALVIENCILRK